MFYFSRVVRCRGATKCVPRPQTAYGPQARRTGISGTPVQPDKSHAWSTKRRAEANKQAYINKTSEQAPQVLNDLARARRQGPWSRQNAWTAGRLTSDTTYQKNPPRNTDMDASETGKRVCEHHADEPNVLARARRQGPRSRQNAWTAGLEEPTQLKGLPRGTPATGRRARQKRDGSRRPLPRPTLRLAPSRGHQRALPHGKPATPAAPASAREVVPGAEAQEDLE